MITILKIYSIPLLEGDLFMRCVLILLIFFSILSCSIHPSKKADSGYRNKKYRYSPIIKGHTIQFFYNGTTAVKEVGIVGTFTGWKPLENSMKQSGKNLWTITFKLPPGKYQYQFIIDGRWENDKFALSYVPDQFAGRVSFFQIK